jgi:endonuclease/exonuclease/phosphatase (EEP) superfamily protein YafD
MPLEERPEARATREIVAKLKRTLALHRGSNTWAAFQMQEIERMEQVTPGYGKFVQTTLAEAPVEDRARLFEFAYIAFNLPQLRWGATQARDEQGEENWWADAEVRAQAAVLEDSFSLHPEQNPRVIPEVVEHISANVPGLGEYVRDYLQSLDLQHEARVNVAILAYVVSEIARSHFDPSYDQEPTQVIV